MKTVVVLGSILVVCLAQAADRNNLDPLTGLPIIPAAEVMSEGKSYGFQALPLAETMVCKSKMNSDMFSIGGMHVRDNKLKVGAAIAWYAAHLSGFKKTEDFKSTPSQIIFSNSDGTVLVSITGDSGAQGQDSGTYAITYQKFQPGISAKTIDGLLHLKLVCN